MQRSPCLDCDLADQDKRNPTCDNCQKRLEYVDGIGDARASMPIEKTDLAEKRDPAMKKRFSEQDNQFLHDNYKTMTHKQLGEKLGRSTASITQRLNRLGLKKHGKHEIGANSIENRQIENKNRDFFILDFSDFRDLFDGLNQIAKDNFRTPENQILYLIKREIERKSH